LEALTCRLARVEVLAGDGSELGIECLRLGPPMIDPQSVVLSELAEFGDDGGSRGEGESAHREGGRLDLWVAVGEVAFVARDEGAGCRQVRVGVRRRGSRRVYGGGGQGRGRRQEVSWRALSPQQARLSSAGGRAVDASTGSLRRPPLARRARPRL